MGFVGGHWPWLLLLAVIALLVFGPQRLPEIGSGLGKAIKEFRKATTEVGESFREEMRKPDETAAATPPPIQAAAPPVAAPPALGATMPPPAPTTPAPSEPQQVPGPPEAPAS